MLRRAALAGLLLLAAAARAEPPPPATSEGVLSFADSLLAAGESYRAATEYLRYLHHYTDSPAATAAWAGLGKAYAQAARWDEAAAAFRQLTALGPSPEARRLLGAALYRGDRHAEAARVLLGGKGEPGVDPTLGTLALLRGGLGAHLPPGARPELAAEYGALPRKSPTLAGSLSAVLPGAGHLYCDRPRDAAVSLLLNGAFLWAALAAAERDEWALAGVLGLFELGWYGGNVVSSVNAAHKWNRREERRFFERHEAGLVPSWSAAPLGGGAGLALSWVW